MNVIISSTEIPNLEPADILNAAQLDRMIHRLSRPWINALAEWQHFIRN